MDIVRHVDELYRTANTPPEITIDMYDSWQTELAANGLYVLAGAIGASDESFKSLRNYQAVREQLVNEVYLGPDQQCGIGKMALCVYSHTSPALSPANDKNTP